MAFDTPTSQNLAPNTQIQDTHLVLTADTSMERNNPAVLDFLRQMKCKPQTAPQQLLTRLVPHEARTEDIVTKQSNCALGGTPTAR